jgi:NADH:ubiquinone oxidoreductase subunit C
MYLVNRTLFRNIGSALYLKMTHSIRLRSYDFSDLRASGVLELESLHKTTKGLLFYWVCILAVAKHETIVYVPSRFSYQSLYFFCHHTNFLFHTVSDITAVDWCGNEASFSARTTSLSVLGRFEVVYNLLSLKYNNRLRVKVLLDEVTPLLFATSIYRGSD